MNRMVFGFVFTAGLAVVAWVGFGLMGAGWLALAMTLAIGLVYLIGVWELHQFRSATVSLLAALGRIPLPLAHAGAWIGTLPPALQQSVRLRIEGERMALPGPALTPYLVGLLVMLGMLGTFLGMVVTFKGAVFALEGSTDMQAIKTALATPIKGLGLSFGTSVAGVAASAMLGLLSAICRRERAAAVRQLDDRISTVLRPFSGVHQREQGLKALQVQADVLPQLVDRLDALMVRLDDRQQHLHESLLGQQASFHQQAHAAYTDLAQAVGQSLQASLMGSAEVASQAIQPIVTKAMAGLADESRQAQAHLNGLAQTQLTVLSDRFDALLTTVQRALDNTVADIMSSNREQSSSLLDGMTVLRNQSEGLINACVAQDQRVLDERAETMARVHTLIEALVEASARQQAATESLAAAAAQVLEGAGLRFSQTLDAHAGRADDWMAQIGASAVDLSCLGEAFTQGVQHFSASNSQLMENLQRIEVTMSRSIARSDEQLAYYVAQAREVIDLSLTSQQGLVESVRRLQHDHQASMAEVTA